MSQENDEIIQKLERLKDEMQLAAQELKDNRLAFDTLAQEVQRLNQEIAQLPNADDPLQAETHADYRTQLKVASEKQGTLQNAFKLINERTNQIYIKYIEYSFQLNINVLWAKETFYRETVDTSGKAAAELLFERQGFKLMHDISDNVISCCIDDYERLGRSDIVQLLRKLSNPLEHDAIFKTASEKYKETNDEHYGMLLSLCHEKGYGTKTDKKKAFEIDQGLMNRGSILALCSIANEYIDGNFLPEDIKKSHEYYTRAIAQQEFYTPHCIWGYKLLNGEDVEKNVEQGLSLLEAAATKKQRFAAVALANYFDMIGDDEIPDCKQRCYTYAELAAGLQSALGTFRLATCYSNAIGVPQDYPRYLALLHQSVELGSVGACMQLACHYTSGIEGILAIDFKRGLALAFQAIRQNISQLEDYEPIFEQHKNNSQFMEIAYSHCLQCLEGHLLDNPLDSVVMGTFYQKGILVPKNLDLAIACLQKAAKQGESEAANALASLCMGSKDTPPSLEPSQMYRLASLVDDSVILSAIKKSRSQYTPLFAAIKEHWNWINAENRKEEMPDVICQLVADYAFVDPSIAKPESDASSAKM